jgi:hypothetical protein
MDQALPRRQPLRRSYLALALALTPSAQAQLLPGDLVLNVFSGTADLVHIRADGTLVRTWTTAESLGNCRGAAVMPDGRVLTSRSNSPVGFSLFDEDGVETMVTTEGHFGLRDTDVFSNGVLVVAGLYTKGVVAFRADGTKVRTYGEGLIGDAVGLYVDREQTLWVTDMITHGIWRFAADGTVLLYFTPGYGANDLVRDAHGDLWTIDAGYGFLRRHAVDGTLLNTYPTRISYYGSGIALARDGSLLVSSWLRPLLHRYSPDGVYIETIPVPIATDGGVIFMSSVPDAAVIGESYCGPAGMNSTGQSAAIQAKGSTAVQLNLVQLTASGLPPNQFGYFLNSTSQGFVNPPGSQGNLCLGGAIGRYSQDVLSTGANGSFSLQLDLTQTPTPGGSVAIQAGETWNFSVWFRDLNPGQTSNFSDGLELTFQ